MLCILSVLCIRHIKMSKPVLKTTCEETEMFFSQVVFAYSKV